MSFGETSGAERRRTSPSASELATRAPATLELAILATIVGVVPGVLLGVLMATRRAGVINSAGGLLSLLGLSIPSFWLGLLLILAFSVHWQLLPPSGYVPLTHNPVANAEHMVMPVFVLALGFAAVVMRQTRSALLEVLRMDYIRAARAKGLTERRVIWVHGLRNALTSVLTVVGLQLGALISGVVITEQIFAIQGIGSLILQSVFTRDYPTLQVVVLFTAVAYVVVNLVTDVMYSVLNPRVRFSEGEV